MKIFTSGDVCNLLGITYRVLDTNLKKVGDVRRTSGNMRIFTEEDVQRLKYYLGKEGGKEE